MSWSLSSMAEPGNMEGGGASLAAGAMVGSFAMRPVVFLSSSSWTTAAGPSLRRTASRRACSRAAASPRLSPDTWLVRARTPAAARKRRPRTGRMVPSLRPRVKSPRAALCAGLHRAGGPAGDAIAPGLLGHVHGGVGALDPGLDGVLWLGHAHADARRHRVPADQGRGGNGLADVVRDGHRVALRRLRKEQDELLAAHAEELVRLPRPAADDVHDPLEHGVPRLVAELVVDPLEVVHVDEEQRRRRRARAGLQHLGQPPAHLAPVVGAGERVRYGLLEQPPL